VDKPLYIEEQSITDACLYLFIIIIIIIIIIHYVWPVSTMP